MIFLCVVDLSWSVTGMKIPLTCRCCVITVQFWACFIYHRQTLVLLSNTIHILHLALRMYRLNITESCVFREVVATELSGKGLTQDTSKGLNGFYLRWRTADPDHTLFLGVLLE